MSSNVIALPKPAVAAPVQAIGEVHSVDDGRYMVLGPDGLREAGCAVGCLVVPEVGDRVLLLSDERHAWVLTVLERTQDGPMRLHAQRDLSVTSAGRLSLGGTTLDAQADSARFAIGRVHWLGRELLAHLARVNWVGDMLDAVSERLRITTRRSYREVVELDQTRAGYIDQRADETYSVRGRHVAVGADELVKVDGGQIHLG